MRCCSCGHLSQHMLAFGGILMDPRKYAKWSLWQYAVRKGLWS